MIPEKSSFNLLNWIEQEAEVLINSWLGRNITPHVNFSALTKDIYDHIFKEIGPSLLSLACTCTTYQTFLDSEYPTRMQSYRHAIKLMNESYRQVKPYNTKFTSLLYNLPIRFYHLPIEENKKDPLDTYDNRTTMEETYLTLVRALSLINQRAAEKIASVMNEEKCQAFTAIAKNSLNKKYAMDMLSLAVKASSDLDNKSCFRNKYWALAPVLKILEQYGEKEEMLKIANLATKDLQPLEHDLRSKFQVIGDCAHILYKDYPERASKMILDAVEELKGFLGTNRYADYAIFEAIGCLLPVYALFDTESALIEFNTIQADMRPLILLKMLDVLSAHDPQKALELRDLAITENPPVGFTNLIAYAKVLTRCHEHEKASEIIKSAFALLDDYDELRKTRLVWHVTEQNFPQAQGLARIEMAKELILFDRKRAIEMVEGALFVANLEEDSYTRCQDKSNIANFLTDLNDESSIVRFTKYALPGIKDEEEDFYKEVQDRAISSLSVALAPFDPERAMKMSESIENKFCKSLTQMKMALRLFHA